jgi:mRNA-degrading endonuclease RelE of RelBE toxin-antitoxin system
MAYEIVFTDTARKHYHLLNARCRSAVKERIETHLRHEPVKLSKSRIKRLRDQKHPEYRLRVDDYRVFYDIDELTVVIIAIVPKTEARGWLDEHGIKKS